jgi:hypothetical protein
MYLAEATLPDSSQNRTTGNRGVGVAYSEEAEGPFTFKNKSFDSAEIGIAVAVDA